MRSTLESDERILAALQRTWAECTAAEQKMPENVNENAADVIGADTKINIIPW